MSNLDSEEVKMQTELYKLGVQNEQLKAEVGRLKDNVCPNCGQRDMEVQNANNISL